jgi:hypothetical protein
MTNDVPYIKQVVAQYNKQLPANVISEVTYSRINTNFITLLFEGTHDLDDAERDLDFPMVTVPWGRIHAGAWSGIEDVLNKENIDNDSTLILCIGHSLGAIEAGMAATELSWRGYSNVECVTFGCPRWGDFAAMRFFKNRVKSRTYRNYLSLLKHDFFVTIPPNLLFNPFDSVPNEITGWSEPTANNEFKGKGVLIEAHSSEDCYLPLVTSLCAMS